AQIAKSLLEGLGGARVDIYKRALLAAIARPELRTGAIAVVRRVRTAAVADALFRLAGDHAVAASTRTAALEALARSPFKFTMPGDLYSTSDEPLARALVQYEFGK